MCCREDVVIVLGNDKKRLCDNSNFLGCSLRTVTDMLAHTHTHTTQIQFNSISPLLCRLQTEKLIVSRISFSIVLFIFCTFAHIQLMLIFLLPVVNFSINSQFDFDSLLFCRLSFFCFKIKIPSNASGLVINLILSTKLTLLVNGVECPNTIF